MRWLRCEWDRALAALCIALGAVAVVLGFLGVSSSPSTNDQLAYIASGGIGGLFLLGLGIVLLVSADLHDEWRKLDRLDETRVSEVEVASPLAGVTQNSAAGRAAARGGERPGPQALAVSSIDSASASGWALAGVSRPIITSTWDSVPLTAIGAAMISAIILLGWREASTDGEMAGALPGVWIALSGLALGGVAAAVKLATLRSVVTRRLRTLHQRQTVRAVKTLSAGPASTDADVLLVFVADGLQYFHRDGCPTLAELSARSIRRDDVSHSLRACPLCQADAARS